ncbi:MAG: dihydropteroate synthase [Bacteroidota bacterium]
MNHLLNVRGRLLDLSTPAVMGILNVTPDSFHDGSLYSDTDAAVSHAERMVAEGAAIIDIGAQSTRPGADYLDAETEWQRIHKLIPLLVKKYPEVVFSIDTFHAEVARRSVLEGCAIVNDVSGGTLDSNMFETIASLQVPYVLMHMKGVPADMQSDPRYDDVIREVFDHFAQKTHALRQAGVRDIIIDPGFGFGKTIDHNYQLLRGMKIFCELDCPVLAGVSRKSMINKVLGISQKEALNGTTVLNTIALLNGASLLRVHDVRQAVEAIRLTQAMLKA